jgi:hypothetical protein
LLLSGFDLLDWSLLLFNLTFVYFNHRLVLRQLAQLGGRLLNWGFDLEV